MLPKLSAATIAIALAVLALAACSRDRAQEERTVEVTTGALEQSVSALGKLEPRTYVDVGAQVSGQLDKVEVEVGDQVAKDQLLAEIDARVIQSRVQANEARVNSLAAQRREQEAQLALAQKQNERNLALYERKLISADVRDTSAAALASMTSTNSSSFAAPGHGNPHTHTSRPAARSALACAVYPVNSVLFLLFHCQIA